MNYTYCPIRHAAVCPSGIVWVQFPDDLPDFVAQEVVEQINHELRAMVDAEVRAMESTVARFEITFPETEISEN